MSENRKPMGYTASQMKAHGDALISIEKHVAAVHVALAALAEDASHVKDTLEENTELLNDILNDYENSEYCDGCEDRHTCVCANTNNGNCYDPECEDYDDEDETDLCVEDLKGNVAICEDLLQYIKTQLSDILGLANRYTGLCTTDADIWGDEEECECARNLKLNGDAIANMIKNGEVTPVKITGEDYGKIVGALKEATGIEFAKGDEVVVNIHGEEPNEGENHCQATEDEGKAAPAATKKTSVVKKEKRSILRKKGVKKTEEPKQE